MTWAVLANKLTICASLTGGITGTIIFIAAGWVGIALMTAFFLMGTLATSWKKNIKQALGLAQENKGRRTAEQVLANAGAAGLLALVAIIFAQHAYLFLFLLACAFSSATADTVSSELGSVYGRKFYDVLSFKKGQRGRDGIISLEGTAFGVLGSVVIAGIYAFHAGWNSAFQLIVIAGTIGNLADSVLGATLERNGIIKNDAVNFLNTVVAVLAGYLLYQV